MCSAGYEQVFLLSVSYQGPHLLHHMSSCTCQQVRITFSKMQQARCLTTSDFSLLLRLAPRDQGKKREGGCGKGKGWECIKDFSLNLGLKRGDDHQCKGHRKMMCLSYLVTNRRPFVQVISFYLCTQIKPYMHFFLHFSHTFHCQEERKQGYAPSSPFIYQVTLPFQSLFAPINVHTEKRRCVS